jgi:hypothetical protein
MRTFLIIAATAAAFAGSAYAEPTAYQPVSQRSPYGYSETQIDTTHLRVSFYGNTQTTREAVEAFVLYRSAEATLMRGYDYFVIADRNVETISEFKSSGPPLPPVAPRNYKQVSRYKATADIVMGRGKRPPELSNAFDAREVQQNLSLKISYRF